jgi:tRNA uridine 5-carboxymethylaminomethyl modification enzyme
MKKFDIIVIGGGHAGCEAAHAVVKMGYICLLITNNIDNLGKMSCNPAIGGLAKGHIVREIDALGGLMGMFADRNGIQFRMLNRSKGPAVWGPRAQIDKNDYKSDMSNFFKNLSGLTLLSGNVNTLILKNNKVYGVRTEQEKEYFAKAVILACGTFLNGLIHIGQKKIKAGRLGEQANTGLTECIKNNDIIFKRLKTGTPARIKRSSIDFTVLSEQKGDNYPQPFSYATETICIEQVSCFLSRTTKKTHSLIKNNINYSPMGAGKIKSTGPRYCPSIETKIINFANKDSHQIFIEPEGRSHPNIYLNGFSNCFPEEIQERLVKTIPGLEQAEIDKPAYAIEYDYFLPTQLKINLESKKIENLFFAGQINGSHGRNK